MKKYLLFLISFTVIFSLLYFSAELISGMWYTSQYVPNIDEAWAASSTLPSQIEMYSNSSPFILTLLLALLSATGGYFVANRLSRSHSS